MIIHYQMKFKSGIEWIPFAGKFRDMEHWEQFKKQQEDRRKCDIIFEKTVG